MNKQYFSLYEIDLSPMMSGAASPAVVSVRIPPAIVRLPPTKLALVPTPLVMRHLEKKREIVSMGS